MSQTCKNCRHVKSSHGYTGYSDGSNDLGKGICRTCEGNEDLENPCKKFEAEEDRKACIYCGAIYPEFAEECPCGSNKFKKLQTAEKNHSPQMKESRLSSRARRDATEGDFNLSKFRQDRKYSKPIYNTRYTYPEEKVIELIERLKKRMIEMKLNIVNKEIDKLAGKNLSGGD